MQLTNEEQVQIARIKEKIPRIAALDPECKLFGSEGWKYQWPKPASEAEIASWEKKHSVTLPREYRIFLRYIANGGPAHAYGLESLGGTDIYGDITKESPVPLYMTQQDVDVLNAGRTEDDEEYSFFDGALTILTLGCTYDICLVVTGQYRGRLMLTDGDEDYPFDFIYDKNFLNWYERWLDDFIAGMSMKGFDRSLPGTQIQLREWFLTEKIPDLRRSILFSLCRFPQIEPETFALWEHVCRTENDKELCEEAFIRLRQKKVSCAADIFRLYFTMPDELRDIAIKDLRFACRDSVVNIEDYIHSLLIIMPELDDDTLSSAVFAIRETEYNKYDTFLPLLERITDDRQQTLLWAMSKAPDFNESRGFIELVLPLFASSKMENVRKAILLLIEVKDNRIPPLVDEAATRFPELTILRENYYLRTWGHKP
ncbi:TPA: SMI1/KNR4 family protein [Escherichia coli]|uniref:SMI1/KNR4 family protein n=1 Tax=Escherichia TaxID=561 RepID=UPI00136D501E|nr:SMI1/KNR4 family protein [Escherichia sp. HH41S]EGO7856308.1 SMI1/KNR4 family protein [Escherichia coli]EGO7860721.1 SMI1/KNR4 family protein [Escherichia coli]EGO7869306.1 SMI1/KNR4 family protein [Escherichia coli]EGO7873953.1 SMI1/KNR4 family protein [Escherichia coli]EGO8674507.1 SMI1/KNR4 family protein [Escherichia coli]